MTNPRRRAGRRAEGRQRQDVRRKQERTKKVGTYLDPPQMRAVRVVLGELGLDDLADELARL